MDQIRRVRLESVVVWEHKVLIISVFSFRIFSKRIQIPIQTSCRATTPFILLQSILIQIALSISTHRRVFTGATGHKAILTLRPLQCVGSRLPFLKSNCFCYSLSQHHRAFSVHRRHPAEKLLGSYSCSLLMKYLYSMLYPERQIHAWKDDSVYAALLAPSS